MADEPREMTAERRTSPVVDAIRRGSWSHSARFNGCGVRSERFELSLAAT
jgi:hypothetical protein